MKLLFFQALEVQALGQELDDLDEFLHKRDDEQRRPEPDLTRDVCCVQLPQIAVAVIEREVGVVTGVTEGFDLRESHALVVKARVLFQKLLVNILLLRNL